MTNTLRSTALAASATALAFVSQSASAAVGAATPATGRAQIVKALTLQAVTNLDFGKIVVSGNGTATLAATGALTCTTGTLVCDPTGTPAEYKVTGSNNQVVTITAPNATLKNQSDPTQSLTLVLTGNVPASVTLPNSGSAGTNFKVGGAIAISESVKDGTYSGDLNVTVEY